MQILQKIPKSIRWQNRELYILDQTQLPLTLVEEKKTTVEEVWEAIKMLRVRGAPAIGIAGAYGLVIAMQNKLDLPYEKFIQELEKKARYLDSARPTAVNLSWALQRIVAKAKKSATKDPKAIFEILVAEAELIHEEDRQICHNIAKHGVDLIKEGMGILTHCNAGTLAVSELGTALAPVYLAHDNGVEFRVYADETRPLLQGSRLTAWELQQADIDVTLICDDMAAHMMASGLIDLVIVGTDRVAANGDIANKIGTLGVAILAKYFSIPFYVACPSSTIDLVTPTGKDIKIEERAENEVTHFGLRRTAPENIKVRNPAFDVTPHDLISGIITDQGMVYAPFEKNLQKFL
jgi:methylthioribose-1-phosphate isomerase